MSALAAADGAAEVAARRGHRRATSSWRACPSSRWSSAGSRRPARPSSFGRRRTTDLSRQLSTFLADASLALEASDSLDGDAAARRRAGPRAHRGRLLCGHRRGRRAVLEPPKRSSTRTEDRRWAAFFPVARPAARSTPSVRSSGRLDEDRTRDEVARAAALHRAAATQPPIHGWLAASMTALDGSELGVLAALQQGGRRLSPPTTRPRSFILPRWPRRRSSGRPSTRTATIVDDHQPELSHRAMAKRSTSDARRVDSPCTTHGLVMRTPDRSPLVTGAPRASPPAPRTWLPGADHVVAHDPRHIDGCLGTTSPGHCQGALRAAQREPPTTGASSSPTSRST